MKTISYQKVANALRQMGIPAEDVFRVEIDMEKMVVYRYAKNTDGRKYLVPGTGGAIAEEIDVVYLVPESNDAVAS